MFGAASVALASFVEKRKRSIDNQLAGKSKRDIPAHGFGSGGFGEGRVGPQDRGRIARSLFAAFDENRDGKLSESELTEDVKKLFQQWDTDHNGELDQRELTAGLQN